MKNDEPPGGSGVGMASPRHISANAVGGMTGGMNAGGVEAMAVRSALGMGGRLGGGGLGNGSLGGAELLYGGGGRLLGGEDVNEVTRAQAALAQAVVEELFVGRKKEGVIPTPGEFRAALREMRETVKAKWKRQRNDARAESARLQDAISLLVSGRGAGREREEVDSEESEEDRGARREWQGVYDRGAK